MNVIPITPNVNVAGFDCGDSDLNDILLEDALHFFEKRNLVFIHYINRLSAHKGI